jgi:hypothetical protein
MPGPPVSALSPRGCHAPRTCSCNTGPRRCPDSRPLPHLKRRQPPLSEAAPRHPLPTVGVRARHTTNTDRPLPPPPHQSPPSRVCTSAVHASPSTPPTPPSTPFGRRRHLLHPVSRGVVAFAMRPCHPHGAVYTASSAVPPSTRR